MTASESDLEMVRRHIREGEVNLGRQRLMIEKLAADGHPTAEARALLVTFEETQALHREHLARLQRR